MVTPYVSVVTTLDIDLFDVSLKLLRRCILVSVM